MFKIFLVEDDPKIAAIVIDSLRKWHLEAELVQDFHRVDEEVQAAQPHLVLLDINLPAYDGFYWCQKIRQTSNVPILFLSSRSTNMDIVMAVNMGADDYVTKPFSLDVLLAKVNALLRRTYSYTEATPAEVIEHGGAVLHLAEKTLAYHGQKLELSRNEFRVLELLLRQTGTVVSRERIMRALWEDESFVDDNTLTVNINRLRKKLTQMGLDEFIVTRKSQGYIIL